MSKPVIGAINGLAAEGGVEFLKVCGIVIVEQPSFGFSCTDIGSCPGWANRSSARRGSAFGVPTRSSSSRGESAPPGAYATLTPATG